MTTRRNQKGATLLVGMIMLVVLTLLVVFAIRSSNTGLQVARNLQSQVEANGAAQKAIEFVIGELKLAEVEDLASLSIPIVPVVFGDKTINVAVAPLICEFERPLRTNTADLNYDNDLDIPCFEGTSGKDSPVGADGLPTPELSACKQQRWRIEATVADADTGASLTHVQGVSVRVSSIAKDCP